MLIEETSVNESALETPQYGAPYSVEIVQPIREGWDLLVATFADACLEQSACYMASRWSTSRLCGLVMRSAASGEAEAIALAVIASVPLLKAGLAYIKFGPLWNRRDKPKRPKVLGAALSAINEQFGAERGLTVRIMPPPNPDDAPNWRCELARAGYHGHGHIQNPDRYLVNLSLSENEQFASLGPKWRANLRKADPRLKISESDAAADFPIFMDLYAAMSKRKQFADHHQIKLVSELVRSAPVGLRPRLFTASLHGRPVAASLVVSAGERADIPFSASGDEALASRAGFALRWAIINGLRGSHNRWLDLGGDEGDQGLRHFKVGNVGTGGLVVPLSGEFDHTGSPLSSLVTSVLGVTQNVSRRAGGWRLPKPPPASAATARN